MALDAVAADVFRDTVGDRGLGIKNMTVAYVAFGLLVLGTIWLLVKLYHHVV